jgi:hypothetical protein
MRKEMRKTLTVLAMALGAACPSYATDFFGTSIPIPVGLVQGDTFQLVFETADADNSTAASTTISTYNAEVTTSANEATSLVDGLGIIWSCLCSTASVNALSNIFNTSPSTTGFAGIYDLAGNFIADGTETTGEGLYSGSLQNPLDHDETGSIYNADVWTGTTSSGTADPDALGSALAAYGDSSTTSTWTDLGASGNLNLGPIYAISGLLELGPNNTLEVLPEPATIWLTAVGLAAGILATRRKRTVPRTIGRGAGPHCGGS